MPNDEMTSNTPMMMSHTPTTFASGARVDNGDPIMIMPASRLVTPTKIDHPLPGRCGSLMAEIVVATPRKMNPTVD